ncbi:MAG: hypothetical protein ACYS0G_11835 [Planctomycetota bacterium]|jgi:T5SS/PEP-CTERM-associated repeat protein
MGESLSRSKHLMIVISAGAFVLFPALVHAGGTERSWINPLGGSFHTSTNWDPLGVPGPADTAFFDITELYTVTFSLNAISELLNVSEGDVSFDLSSQQYTVNGVVVGDKLLDVGMLTLFNGTLAVEPVDPPLSVRIGKDIGADGGLVVSTNASLVSNDTVLVGDAGAGSLEASGGGSISTAIVNVADDLGSTGSVTVDGAGSTLTCSGLLDIGNLGSGSLDVTNGGSLSTARVRIGDELGSTGTATVDGPTTVWTDSLSIVVGNFASGSLAISNGATVSGVTGTIGDEPGSDGEVTVDGADSTWSSTGEMIVGDFGSGSLTASNGGSVSALDLAVGKSASGALSVLSGGSASFVNLSRIGDLFGSDGTSARAP